MLKKLTDNKQIIHIATEIMALLGIIFYFSSKNKKILKHVDDLSARIEEQEDIIQKHSEIIKKLTNLIKNLPKPNMNPIDPRFYSNSFPQQKESYKSKIPLHHIYNNKKNTLKTKNALNPISSPVVKNKEKSIKTPILVEESEHDSSTDEEELDKEISNELLDLEEIDNTDLKKKSLPNMTKNAKK